MTTSRDHGPNASFPLHEAAAAGKVEDVRHLLGAGHDADACDDRGRTPLLCAATAAHAQVAQLLVEAGADVNVAHRDSGKTVLHCALSHGDERLAALLVSRGADVAAVDRNGRTALHDAAQGAAADVVALLLAKGADVHARADDWGETPLHCAAGGVARRIGLRSGIGRSDRRSSGFGRFGILDRDERADERWRLAQVPARRRCVELLLAAGADARAATRHGATALHAAASDRDAWLVERLLAAGADPLARDAADTAPLHQAAAFGDAQTVRLLLAAGADPNAPDGRGFTPLYHAAGNVTEGAARIVDDLVEAGADVRRQPAGADPDRTPLSRAVSAGSLAVVERLVAHGAPVDQLAFGDRPAIHWAAAGDRPDVVRLLVRRGGADVNARSCEPLERSREARGRTPMHEAARHGALPAIAALLELGADVDARDVRGQTPLHWAVREARVDAVAALLAAGADPDARTVAMDYDPQEPGGLTPLHEACRRLRAGAAVPLLLAAGADPNAADDRGNRPLHYWDRDSAALAALVAHGADVNARNAAGAAPLHCSPGDARLLTGAGADPNARDGRGRTALHLCVAWGNIWDTVGELIDCGADPDLPDADGQTPLHLAAAIGRGETIKMLLSKGADRTIRNPEGLTPAEVADGRGHIHIACLIREHPGRAPA